MGISSEHIILYGYEVPYDEVSEWDESTYEQWLYRDADVGEVAVIADGMSGEYALIGVLQFCSNDRRWDVADIPMTKISPPSREAERQLMLALQETELDRDGEPDHFIFTHHS